VQVEQSDEGIGIGLLFASISSVMIVNI
jgi:hypothetical protein